MKPHSLTIKKTICLITSLLVVLLFFNTSPAQKMNEETGEEEETYSISLVQTAGIDKEIYEVDDKRVFAEAYFIQAGDYLWKILRERGLLEKRNIMETISILKKLNPSLSNLNLIYPGQKVIIPLTISPGRGAPAPGLKITPIPISLDALKDMDMENYTVSPGDSLVKIIKSRYTIPQKEIYNEYLSLVKRLNPSVNDLDAIYPGQIIRLPVYSPQIVRMPVKPIPSPEPKEKAQKKELSASSLQLNLQLKDIFSQMGEEWVHSGQHFIPLKSGGQVNLKADSFPVINLSNGDKVIVDLHSDLPEKMTKLIKSSWGNYRVVHLGQGDALRTAFDKILPLCNYSKIYRLGDPFELGGDIPLQITADWIIEQDAGSPDKKISVITLTDEPTPKTPQVIKDFLSTLGIKAIDYPLVDKSSEAPPHRGEILHPGNDPSALIEQILKLSGRNFTPKVEIPVYKGQQTDFNLVVKADFLINLNGRDGIIDLTGLGPDIISLLQEHRFSVLSLATENDPYLIVSKALDLLGIKFDSNPHSFMATGRDKTRNIRLTIPGIIFRDSAGRTIFATHLRLPDGIVRFLSQRGYIIMSLFFY